jgi:hypothetical protein
MVVARWIEQLATDRAQGTGDHLIQGVHCRRVGRNDVWRVKDGMTVYFVTFCKSDKDFHRRLAGIELCERIARGTTSIVAPRLEAVIDDSRTIVTHMTQGRSVDQLFRDAYRVDRNPFRRRAPQVTFLRALEAISQFLAAFHESEPISREHLWNHGPEAVSQRIRSHLTRLAKRIDALRGWDLPVLPGTSGGRLGMVLGDVSLGNFLIDGRQLTCVDFEDIGIGEAYRDRVLLSHSLKQPLRQWHYWQQPPYEMLPIPPGDPWYALYALEVELHSVWRELSGSSGGRRLDRALESARRQWAVVVSASGSR